MKHGDVSRGRKWLIDGGDGGPHHIHSESLFNLLIGWGGAFGRAPKGPVDAWLLANQLAMTSRQWLSISWLALKPKIQFS